MSPGYFCSAPIFSPLKVGNSRGSPFLRVGPSKNTTTLEGIGLITERVKPFGKDSSDDIPSSELEGALIQALTLGNPVVRLVANATPPREE